MNLNNSSITQRTIKAVIYSLALTAVVTLPILYYMKNHDFSEVSQGIAAVSLGFIAGLIGALLSL